MILYRVHQTREDDNVDSEKRKQQDYLVDALLEDFAHYVERAYVTRELEHAENTRQAENSQHGQAVLIRFRFRLRLTSADCRV